MLASGTAAIARLRTARKPLHPYGETWVAHLSRSGTADHPTGVAWLDTPGDDDVVVRLSTGIGMPDGWPDILGLALRLPGPGGPADVLLSTTGSGRLTRFLPRPTRTRDGRTFGSLLPLRGPKGPVLLAATERSPSTFALAHATLTGPWREFGRLELRGPAEGEPSFHPVDNTPSGFGQYRWVALLRAPAYRTARRSRGEDA